MLHKVLADQYNTGSRRNLLPIGKSSIARTTMSVLTIRTVITLRSTVVVIPVIVLWTMPSTVMPVIRSVMVWTMMMPATSH